MDANLFCLNSTKSINYDNWYKCNRHNEPLNEGFPTLWGLRWKRKDRYYCVWCHTLSHPNTIPLCAPVTARMDAHELFLSHTAVMHNYTAHSVLPTKTHLLLLKFSDSKTNYQCSVAGHFPLKNFNEGSGFLKAVMFMAISFQTPVSVQVWTCCN